MRAGTPRITWRANRTAAAAAAVAFRRHQQVKVEVSLLVRMLFAVLRRSRSSAGNECGRWRVSTCGCAAT